MHPDTPNAAVAARLAILATVIPTALTLLPVKYSVYAAAVIGCCASITAAWKCPANSTLALVWGVINILGANVGYAKNHAAPPVV